MSKSFVLLIVVAGMFLAGPSQATESPDAQTPAVETICLADAEQIDPLGEALEATHGGSCPWTPSLFCDCIPSSSRQNCIDCCNHATDTCIANCTAPLALCTYECEQNGAECTNQCYIHW